MTPKRNDEHTTIKHGDWFIDAEAYDDGSAYLIAQRAAGSERIARVELPLSDQDRRELVGELTRHEPKVETYLSPEPEEAGEEPDFRDDPRVKRYVLEQLGQFARGAAGVFYDEGQTFREESELDVGKAHSFREAVTANIFERVALYLAASASDFDTAAAEEQS